MSRYGRAIRQILQFNRVRGWSPLPEDLAKSITIEAAELLEHFQWDATDRQKHGKEITKEWQEISFETVDVFWYLILFCHSSRHQSAGCCG